ncbi:MAG: cytochrome c [Acidimicrobiia bacterium]|nr:cytochrome c [Acidimicrobiia bacterium]
MRKRVSAMTFAVALLMWLPAAAQDQAQVQKGMAVYAEQKCGICHAIAGKGNAKGPLDDVGSRLGADEIRDWMVDAPGMTAKSKSTRKPPMRSYPKLSKEELDALVAYMLSLRK